MVSNERMVVCRIDFIPVTGHVQNVPGQYIFNAKIFSSIFVLLCPKPHSPGPHNPNNMHIILLKIYFYFYLIVTFFIRIIRCRKSIRNYFIYYKIVADTFPAPDNTYKKSYDHVKCDIDNGHCWGIFSLHEFVPRDFCWFDRALVFKIAVRRMSQ